MADAPPLKVGIPLYEDFDSLDVIGPYQTFTFAGMDLYLLGPTMESVKSFEGIALMPRATFAASTQYDMASKSTRTILTSVRLITRSQRKRYPSGLMLKVICGTA
jgi:putative intracellular protease/amidase